MFQFNSIEQKNHKCNSVVKVVTSQTKNRNEYKTLFFTRYGTYLAKWYSNDNLNIEIENGDVYINGNSFSNYL